MIPPMPPLAPGNRLTLSSVEISLYLSLPASIQSPEDLLAFGLREKIASLIDPPTRRQLELAGADPDAAGAAAYQDNLTLVNFARSFLVRPAPDRMAGISSALNLSVMHATIKSTSCVEEALEEGLAVTCEAGQENDEGVCKVPTQRLET